MRLNKYLASAGVCSRRDADKLIEKGFVLVDGRPALMGEDVSGEEEIRVRGKRISGPEKKHVIAYYKPIGVTCSERDAHAESLILEHVKFPVRLTYAGRLDRDSEGLMLLSNDGDLLHGMMQGANRHEKEYVVRVHREITDDFVVRMEQGVFLKELNLKTRPCKVVKDGPYTFHITLTQGVNRQIRRMCKTLGYRVESLKRVRIMNILLGTLEVDKWREITGEELRQLYAQALGKEREN